MLCSDFKMKTFHFSSKFSAYYVFRELPSDLVLSCILLMAFTEFHRVHESAVRKGDTYTFITRYYLQVFYPMVLRQIYIHGTFF